MGCTWFSVVSLAALILSSFLANMKANSQTLAVEATTKKDMALDSTEVPTTPSPAADRTTTHKVVTMDLVDSSDNCSFNQLQNIEKVINMSETKNCLNLITTPVSVEVNSSSNEYIQGEIKSVITYRDFPEYKHYKNVDRLYPYLNTIPGFITNPLSILIAMQIKPRHPCEIYMIVLGFADLLTVTGRFIFRMMDAFGGTRYNWDCKLLWYMFTVGQVFSNLVVMAWTVERFIAVIFPMKLGLWCSIRNTKITLGLLFLFTLVASIPIITEIESMNFWNGKIVINVCEVSSQTIYGPWSHLETVYFLYIPIVVVAVCNVMILVKLSAMTKARVSMASNQEIIDKKAKENRRMTILLLSISGTFIFLHIPYIICNAVEYVYYDFASIVLADPDKFAKILLYTHLGYLLTEFQNCINFFLYCISGTKFRRTFLDIFCKCFEAKKMDTLPTSRTDTTKI